jgi:hypothetical protein
MLLFSQVPLADAFPFHKVDIVLWLMLQQFQGFCGVAFDPPYLRHVLSREQMPWLSHNKGGWSDDLQ